MTPEQRQAARARCEKATRGPWAYDGYNTIFSGVAEKIVAKIPDHPTDDEWTEPQQRSQEENEKRSAWYAESESNAWFFQHARTDLPAALDALDQSDKRIAELEADKARLDLMTENSIGIVRSANGYYHLLFDIGTNEPDWVTSGQNVRALLDEAAKVIATMKASR